MRPPRAESLRGRDVLLISDRVRKPPSSYLFPISKIGTPSFPHIILSEGSEKLTSEDWMKLKQLNPIYVGSDWTYSGAPLNGVIVKPQEVIVDCVAP